jgi:hypothetical protein
MWNFVSDIKGGTQTGGIWEQGAQENILTYEIKWREAGENCIMRSSITCILLQV